MGLGGGERPAGQNELLGQSRPELPDQPRDSSPGQGDPELYLGNGKARVLRGDPDVAGGGENHGTADAVPMNGRDRHRRDGADGVRHPPAEIHPLRIRWAIERAQVKSR